MKLIFLIKAEVQMVQRGLVWFKNDLRLHDNEALTKALEECSELVCCYCLERGDFDMLELASDGWILTDSGF